MMKLEEMLDIRYQANTNINEMFCGYLRQPIHVKKKGEKYIVTGKCSKNNEWCVKKSPFICEYNEGGTQKW